MATFLGPIASGIVLFTIATVSLSVVLLLMSQQLSNNIFVALIEVVDLRDREDVLK